MNVFELIRVITSIRIKSYLVIYLLANILLLTNSKSKNLNYVEELNDRNFSKFVEENNVYFICLCKENEKSTREIKNILSEVGKKWETDYLLDKNTNSQPPRINSALFDPLKYKGFSLQSKFIYEGFPTLYYVNKSNNEIEAYIGSKNVISLSKYLRHKLIFDIEEVPNESNLEKLFNINKTKSAMVVLGNPGRLTLETIAKAAKIAGFPGIYSLPNNQNETEQYNLAIYYADSELDKIHKLNITINESTDVNKLSQIILINNRCRNQGYFYEFSDIDLEYALNRDIPTMLYLYSDKKQLPTDVEADFVELAQKYRNEILFVKGSINSKSLKQLQFQRVFNITKIDLPVVVYLRQNPFNDDDVEKYILKTQELAHKNSASLTISDLLNKRTVENLIRNVNKGKKEKIFTTEHEEVSFKLTGENFLPVLGDAIEEEKEIILMICPRVSKKYDRIKKRMERVFEKLYNINENKILFDEFDPFTNELSLIEYKFHPTLVFIQSDPEKRDSKIKWKYTRYEKDFSNEEIIKFIKENSRFDVKIDNTMNDKYVNKEEKKYPIFPILKHRFERKFLTDNLVKYQIGLKRRWFVLKKNRLVMVNEDVTVYESGNEYEEDVYNDSMDASDENVLIDKREEL